MDPADQLERFVVPVLAAAERDRVPKKGAVILFDPTDEDEPSALYSNASAADLIPVLRAVLARLENGHLRMPTDDCLRWKQPLQTFRALGRR